MNNKKIRTYVIGFLCFLLFLTSSNPALSLVTYAAAENEHWIKNTLLPPGVTLYPGHNKEPILDPPQVVEWEEPSVTEDAYDLSASPSTSFGIQSLTNESKVLSLDSAPNEQKSEVQQEDELPVPFVLDFLLSDKDVGELMLAGAGGYDRYQIHLLASQQTINPLDIWRQKKESGLSWKAWLPQSGLKLVNSNTVSQDVYGVFPGQTLQDAKMLPSLSVQEENYTAQQDTYSLESSLSSHSFISPMAVRSNDEATVNNFQKNMNSYLKLISPLQINQIYKEQYSDRHKTSESIDPATGALTWKFNALHYPGRDGLDMDLGLMYQSNQATSFLEANALIPVIVYRDGATSLQYKNIAKSEWANENYLFNTFQLGNGWSFQLPSLQIERPRYGQETYYYYHNGGGASYQVKFGESATNLVNPPDTMTRFMRGGSFSNGQTNATYYMEYPDKKREYFNDQGQLIGVVDRFQNKIIYEYGGNPLQYIQITDTVGRKLRIEYQRGETENAVSVYSITPDGKKRAEIVLKGQPQKWQARDRGDTLKQKNDYIQDVNPVLRTLSYVSDDAGGNRQYLWTAKFNYMDRARAEFSYTSRNWNTQEGVGTMAAFPLSEVEYPHSQTYYDYTRVVHNMGRDGLQQEFVVSQRADEPQKKDGSKRTNLVNQVQYMYRGDYTGFPQATSLENMSTGYTYEQQALTMEQGNQTFRTVTRFNYKGQTQDILRYGVDEQSSLTNYEAYDSNFKFKPTRSKETIIDSVGQITRYTEQKYDINGNLIQETAPLTSDQLASADTKQKRSTFYTYEPQYNQIQTKSTYQNDTTQLTSTYAYTTDGRVSMVRDALGQETNTTYTKTPEGIVSQVIVENPVRQGVKARTVTEYGIETAYALPAKIKTYFLSANNGTQLQNTKSYVYDLRTGLLMYDVNDENHGNVYSYDELGRIQTMQRPIFNTGNGIYTVIDHYNYKDGFIDRQDGSPIVAGMIVSSYQEVMTSSLKFLNYRTTAYDGFGMILTDSLTNINYRDNPTKVTRYTTDTKLRPIRQTTTGYDLSNSSSPKLISATIDNIKINYDSWDQPISTTDAQGNTTKIKILPSQFKRQLTFQKASGEVLNSVDEQYDQWGNLSQSIAYQDAANRANPIRETYTYDIAGNVITYTDPNANETVQHPRNREGVTQSYKYDRLNRPVQLLNALNQITSYAYDGNNQVIKASIQDATDTAIIFNKEFNEKSQLLSKTDPASNSIQNEYNVMGRLQSSTDRNGTNYQYKYDSWGRVMNYTLIPNQSDLSAIPQTLSYTYDYAYYDDIQKHLIRMEEGSSTPVEQQSTFDTLGRIVNEREYTANKGNQKFYNAITNITYHSIGQVSSRQIGLRSGPTYIVGSMQKYDYDTKGQLEVIHVSNNNSSEKIIQYTYTPQGKVDTITYPIMENGQILKTQNIYQDLNRLSSSITQMGQNIVSQSSYKYDANGNITQSEETISQKTLKLSNYTYDALNRLTGVRNSVGETVIYTYDLRGNRLTQTEDRRSMQDDLREISNSYDAKNQLKKSSIVNKISDAQGNVSSNEVKAEFSYLPDGSRYEKKVSESNGTTNQLKTLKHTVSDDDNKVVFEATTNYIKDSSNPSETKPSDPVFTEYIRSDRVLLKKNVGSNKLYYYIYNGHGDVKSILDDQGNTVNTYDYDEFGNITAQKEQIENPFKYAGEYFDEETKMYHLNARYYDPSMGRFIQEDTVEGQINNPLSLNLYTYVENDPINMIDPEGNEPQKPSQESPYGGAMPTPKGGNKGGGGGITFGVVASLIAKVESAIRHKKIEYGQFFDSTGKKVGERIKGTETSIDLSPYKNIAENKIFTHNHPRNRTFSLEDIDTAIQYDMAEIRAVTPNGRTMSMKRKGDSWKVSDYDIWRIFRTTEQQLKNDPDVVALYKAGKYEEVDDILMRQIASRIGGDYRVH